jgi:alanine racemase
MGMSTFGADVMAYNVSTGLRSLKFDLRLGSERYTDQEMDIIGAHHLYGVMAALAVGSNYDIPIAESLNVLREISPLAGRMNPLGGSGGWLLVDDTYSTDTATTRMLLDWTRQVRSQVGRVVLVLGDYEPSVVQHDSTADLGQAIASAVDTLVALGSQGANAARQARRCGLDADAIYTTYSYQDVLHTIHEHVIPNDNDVVIVTGHDRNLRNLNCVPPMRAIIEALGEKERHSTPAAGSAPPDQGVSNYVAMTDRSRLSWLELDYAALAENVRQMKQLIGNKVALMAVVKADAYGHGAVACAHTALVNGASWLGVSSVYDALALREAGVTAPILAMNYVPLADARTAIVNNITATVYDVALAKAYNRIAGQLNKRLHVHVKVDSGMGRLGVMGKEVIDLCRQIAGMDYLKIGGIYTHFSTADGEPAYVDEQLKLFREVIRKIQASLGLRIRPVHAANTAATLVSPEAHFDMVRVGLGLYGMYPSAVDLPDGFRPVMSWKTTVCQVKTLPANHPVGYGNTYVTSAPERVAVLPIGYGDGLRRTPHAWSEVLIHGERAPILGRISMEKTVVSVHHIPGVMVGDEVVLLGEQGSERITAEEIADTLQTINYEITSSILPRVERH